MPRKIRVRSCITASFSLDLSLTSEAGREERRNANLENISFKKFFPLHPEFQVRSLDFALRSFFQLATPPITIVPPPSTISCPRDPDNRPVLRIGLRGHEGRDSRGQTSTSSGPPSPFVEIEMGKQRIENGVGRSFKVFLEFVLFPSSGFLFFPLSYFGRVLQRLGLQLDIVQLGQVASKSIFGCYQNEV